LVLGAIVGLGGVLGVIVGLGGILGVMLGLGGVLGVMVGLGGGVEPGASSSSFSSALKINWYNLSFQY
jgi:hypothetical protein